MPKSSRSTRREIINKLLRLGIASPKNAEFVLRYLLGDDPAPTNSSQKDILDRLETFVNAGEDIVVDLRMHNGKVLRYDEFWSIASKYIEDKTAVSDRRHDTSDGEGDIVVHEAIANSYSQIYRSCIDVYVYM